MFIMGRIATEDGTPVPHDAVVERVCNARVRQQVYASGNGDFSMQLGSMGADSFVDASGDGEKESPLQSGQMNKYPGIGIPRQELNNCEMRATVSGFRSNVVNLMALIPDNGSINIGDILLHRYSRVKGLTVSASPYQAPKDARKAYEKGMDAAKDGKLSDARRYFEQAVAIHPKYVDAWFQLGTTLRGLKLNDPAREAYLKAVSIDNRFLPPYLSLATMAVDKADWAQVIDLTNHIIDRDPLRNAHITGYILDTDSFDYAQAYFYNSAANYWLNHTEAAEKSGLTAERMDTRSRFPQLHIILAEIFAAKNEYPAAISEIKIYLGLVPHAKNADEVRNWLAKLESSGIPTSANEQQAPN
jgi:hypothetical protein